MAVVAGKRKEGDLKVLTISGKLCDYTLQITANEKCFPKRYRWSLTNRILQTTLDIDDYLVLANEINIEEGYEAYIERLKYQRQAMALTKVLLRNIERAYRRFGIDAGRISYWTAQVKEVRRLIAGWHYRDKKRYGENYG